MALASSVFVTRPHGQAPASLPTRGIEEIGQVYVGEPVSTYLGHMAMLFVTGKHPLVSAGSMQDTVDWVNDPLHSVIADGTGGLAVFAHPTEAWPIQALNNLTGMEVYRLGVLPNQNPFRDQMWDAVLSSLYSQGKPLIWAFAADDTHYTVNPGVNYDLAWNVALVPSMDLPSLKIAFRNGAFYPTNGPSINSVSASGTTITLNLGQSSQVLWLRAGQYDTGGTFTQSSTLLGANTAVKIQPNVTTSTIDISSLGVALSGIHYVRAIVRTSPTVYAMTQPFQVSSTGVISNPYPASGLWLRGETHNHDDAWIGDGGTGVTTYRSNYQSVGQSAAFETAYSYWEVPYQRLDSDGMPDLTAVSPATIPYGAGSVITVTGVNFESGIGAQIGSYPLTNVVLDSSTQLHGTVPASAPPGVYDVVVTNPDHYRGNLALSLTIQESAANNSGWTSYGAPDLPWNQATSIMVNGNNEVWVGTVKGAAQYKSGVWSTFIPTGGLNAFAWGIYDITEDGSGGMWFASSGLWYRGPSGAFPWQNQLVNDPSGTTERWGRMAWDKTGQLWVTSRWAEGLAIRSTSGTWTRWTNAGNGLPNDENQAIICDYQGNMWVAFGVRTGIRKWNGSTWTQVSIPSALPQASYASVLVNGTNNDVWAAVQPFAFDGPTAANSGVVHYLSDGTTQVFTTPQLPAPRITAILPTPGGDVWFASRAGVARLSAGGQWQTFTTRNSGLASNIVTAMAVDQAGTIWFATANGVSSYSPGGFAFSLSNSGGISVTAGNSGTSTITATLASSPAQSVGFTVTGLPAGASASFSQTSCSPTCSTVMTVATTTSTAGGTYPLTVSGTAGSLVQTTRVNLTVTGADQPPVVTNPGSQTSVQGATVSLQIVASDPNGYTLSYSATGLPTGLSINATTGLISGTVASNAAATNNVTVTVNDGHGGTAQASFSWSVTATKAPVATNDSYGTVENTTLSVAAPGVLANDTDPNGYALTAILLTGTSHGTLTFNSNGSFTYVPALNYYGGDSFTYVAHDGLLNSNTATVTITVAAINYPPAVATPANQTNYAGESVSLAIVASDPNGNTLSYAATGLPTGLTISATTGVIGGTASATAAASNSVTVTVSDGNGGVTSATFSWTVISGIVLKGSRFVSKDTSTNTLVFPLPSNVVAGNLMLVAVSVRGNPGVTVPSGWSQVNKTTATGMKQIVYYKVAGTTEPVSYTWSFGNNRGACGTILVYGGVDPGTPIDTKGNGLASGSSTLITAPSVNTKTVNTTLVGIFGIATATTIAPPPGMTERGELAQTAGTDTITLEVADATWPPIGATGTQVATAAAAASNVGQLVALRVLTR